VSANTAGSRKLTSTMRGSTFLVEMKDIEVMLREATANSLVIIDELGRGTSTFDGHAIAFAVLCDLVERLRCRTLLSTHYHGLVKDFSEDARILPMHMACRVDDASKQLVMLYKLQQGVCPQSYGMECGLRAGLPPHIIERARVKSQEFEATQHAREHAKDAGSHFAKSVGEGVGKRPRLQAFEGASGGDGGVDADSVRKFRKLLELVPSDRALQGMDAVRVFRQLSELREILG